MYEDYRALRFERRGRVLTVTMSRPQTKNAVDDRMHTELAQLFADLARDPDCDVIVLTGEGDAFSAGGDIGAMQEKIADRRRWITTIEEARRIFYGMLDLEKPLIARVNGAAVGLGATLAVYADIAVAAESAVIGDPHTRVGLVAGDGGALLWPFVVGFQRAKELLFTGEILPAREAARLGLIAHCVPDAELDAKVEALAERLARGPRHAIGWTKRAMHHSLRMLAHGTMEASLLAETLSQLTDDHAEALDAFQSRRKPRFSGN